MNVDQTRVTFIGLNNTFWVNVVKGLLSVRTHPYCQEQNKALTSRHFLLQNSSIFGNWTTTAAFN